MKNYNILILLLVCILSLSSCQNYTPDIQNANAATIASSEAIEKYTLNIDNLRITNTQNKDFYFITNHYLAEDNSYYSVSISYPYFSNEELDKKVSDILNKHLENYISAVNSKELEKKSYFSFSYNILQTYDYLTFKFFTEVKTSEFACYDEDFTIDIKNFYPDYKTSGEKETVKNSIILESLEELPSESTAYENAASENTADITEAALEFESSEAVKNSQKMLALTFDDGPNPNTTAVLLDALKERNIKATFFMVGYNIEKYPEIVKRIYDEGHCIGNHTYGHVNLTATDIESAKMQYTKVEDLLTSIIQKGSDLFRPPYGNHNEKTDSFINSPVILWSIDPRDWEYKNCSTVYNHIIDNVSDGDIILLHDLYPTSVEAAIKAIDYLCEKGYSFVRADELIKRNGEVPQNGTSIRNNPYKE